MNPVFEGTCLYQELLLSHTALTAAQTHPSPSAIMTFLKNPFCC